MNHIIDRSLFMQHLVALTSYINYLNECSLDDDIKDNLKKIKKSKELFEKDLNRLIKDPAKLTQDELSIIRHDLRNQLNGIGGYAELCLESMDENKINSFLKSFFQVILLINNKLLELVNETANATKAKHPVLSGEKKTTAFEAQSIQKIMGAVLIVEDNKTNLDLLAHWLTSKGYKVYSSLSGDDALQTLAKKTDIDVIILDILMPGKDGYAVLKEIRANRHYSEISIIMLSALNDMESIVKCVQAGAEDYLIKPFNAFLLDAKIKSSIEKKHLRVKNLQRARESGMSEIAIDVLHNVGNILNTVNCTTSLITEKIKNTELSELSTIKNILNANKDNLTHFLTHDQRGQAIIQYISLLADYWEKEQTALLSSLKLLNEKIQNIINIIATQQAFGKSTGVTERIDLVELIEYALTLHNELFIEHHIFVQRHYDAITPVVIDKNKLLQVIVNLIKNAIESLTESKQKNKTLSINLNLLADNNICLQIIDNGQGIEPSHLQKLFTSGFTTKEKGLGLGLHGSALAAHQLNGNLIAKSEGIGKGASFSLYFPLSRDSQHEQ